MSDSTIGSPTSTLPRCSTDEGTGPAGAVQDGTCATGSGRLSGIVRAVGNLTGDERERLYILLTRYFANVTRTQFEQDLAEKDRVILLTDGLNGQIQGFSTLMQLHILVNDRPVVAQGPVKVHRAADFGAIACVGAPTIQCAYVRRTSIAGGHRRHFTTLTGPWCLPRHAMPSPDVVWVHLAYSLDLSLCRV